MLTCRCKDVTKNDRIRAYLEMKEIVQPELSLEAPAKKQCQVGQEKEKEKEIGAKVKEEHLSQAGAQPSSAVNLDSAQQTAASSASAKEDSVPIFFVCLFCR